MTPMVVFFVLIVLIATLSFLFNNAGNHIAAFLVGLAGQLAVLLLVVPEAREAVEASGRMEPITALLGAWIVAVICGACMAEGITSWARKATDK